MKAAALSVVLTVALGGCELMPKAPAAQLPPAVSLPQTSGTYLNMGRYFLSQGQPELAHDAFIRSLRVEGVSAAAFSGAGVAAEKQGLLHQAERYFEKAVRLAPNSVVAFNNLGAVRYQMGQFTEAKHAFETAFKLSSGQSPVAGLNLALVERAMNEADGQQLALAPNPVPLQRQGTGEYALGTPRALGTEE